LPNRSGLIRANTRPAPRSLMPNLAHYLSSGTTDIPSGTTTSLRPNRRAARLSRSGSSCTIPRMSRVGVHGSSTTVSSKHDDANCSSTGLCLKVDCM
jgi:hypothetical protein